MRRGPQSILGHVKGHEGARSKWLWAARFATCNTARSTQGVSWVLPTALRSALSSPCSRWECCRQNSGWESLSPSWQPQPYGHTTLVQHKGTKQKQGAATGQKLGPLKPFGGGGMETGSDTSWLYAQWEERVPGHCGSCKSFLLSSMNRGHWSLCTWLLRHCYRQNCVPPNSYVGALILHVTIFRDRAFKDGIGVKWYRKGDPPSDRTGVHVTEEDVAILSPSSSLSPSLSAM